MSLTATESAIIDGEQTMSMTAPDAERDLRKVERAMAKRARQMKAVDPTRDEIPEYDRNLFGRPVRIEVDVCIPIDELRKLLNSIRADVTDAMMALEKSGTPSDRRFACHRRLCDARGKAYALGQRLKAEGRKLPGGARRLGGRRSGSG